MQERPYLLAVVAVGVAVVVGAGLLLGARQDPGPVLVGLGGFHDRASRGERAAACVDCHVPFLGTPDSRCLSPGCHGELASGAPERAGPAMPVRFHVAIRDQPCGRCHHEHREVGVTASPRFEHALMPQAVADECRRCHGARSVASHSRTDAVSCARCHALGSWRVQRVDHTKVEDQFCDVCHVAPDNDAHRAAAGTCATCHGTDSWAAVALDAPAK